MRVPRGRYDLVLCRNTVIYFNADVRDDLHARLVGPLRPGGVLVVGATERVADPRGAGLRPPRPLTYRGGLMDVAEYLPHVHRRVARAPRGARPRGRAHRGARPTTAATIDEIFRIAHSFKGMSATMGYDGMAELTHAMEDVFELLRRRRDGLDRAAVDVLLACLDALEATVDRIDARRRGGDRPGAVERLAAGRRAAGAVARARPRSAGRPPTGPAERAAGRVLHVVVTCAEDVEMPAVRAFMVLGEAGRARRRSSAPSPTPRRVDGFAGPTVELWMPPTADPDATARRARAGVADVA